MSAKSGIGKKKICYPFLVVETHSEKKTRRDFVFWALVLFSKMNERMIHRSERSGSNGKPRRWAQKTQNPNPLLAHTEGCVLSTIPTDAFSRYANFMQVASVFAWGVGGRRLNNAHRCDATPDAFHRGECLTDKQGERALLPASIFPTTRLHHHRRRRQRPRLALSNVALVLSLLRRD